MFVWLRFSVEKDSSITGSRDPDVSDASGQTLGQTKRLIKRVIKTGRVIEALDGTIVNLRQKASIFQVGGVTLQQK